MTSNKGPIDNSPQDFISAAEQEARVLRHSRRIPEGPVPLDVLDARIEEGRQFFRARNWTNAKVARGMGTNQTYVSNMFSADTRDRIPRETLEQLVRDLHVLMENVARSTEIRRPENFVEHGAAKRLVIAGVQTMQIGCIGVPTGPPGVGKSLTCRWIASGACPLIAGAVLVEITPDSATPRGLREAIFEACRGRVTQSRPQIRHLVERLHGRSLLIVDQAHLLKNAALLDIQALHDAASLPILLVGTVDIDRRTSDEYDPLFAQLSSRIGLRTDLIPAAGEAGGGARRRSSEWVSLEQLRKMFDAGRIRLSDDGLLMLLEVALFEPGHLRRCKYLVTIAAAAVRGEGGDVITAAHLVAAGAVVTGKRRTVHAAASEARKAATA